MISCNRPITELILGDICVFNFDRRSEYRVIRELFTGVIDGQSCIKVAYMDGTEVVYPDWVKILVAPRN